MVRLNHLTGKKNAFSVVITIFVVSLLFLIGPSSAFQVFLTANSNSVNFGDTIEFQAVLEIPAGENVPINQVLLMINGVKDANCSFNPYTGSVISGCDGIIIDAVDYNHSFGAINISGDIGGYGYGFGYGYGYGSLTNLVYNITLDTDKFVPAYVNYTATLIAYVSYDGSNYVPYTPTSIEFAINYVPSSNEAAPNIPIYEVDSLVDTIVFVPGTSLEQILIGSDVSDSQEIFLDMSLVLDSGDVEILSAFSLSRNNYSVSIPAGTVITYTCGTWDGTMMLPILRDVNDYNSPNLTDIITVIEVGFLGCLEFDMPVTVTLPGMAGNKAGYTKAGSGLLTEILECSPSKTLLGLDECYYEQGDDLIILTNHFTSFAAYESETVEESSSSSRGRNVGSSSNVILPVSLPEQQPRPELVAYVNPPRTHEDVTGDTVVDNVVPEIPEIPPQSVEQDGSVITGRAITDVMDSIFTLPQILTALAFFLLLGLVGMAIYNISKRR
ncbi:MAG: hypothetical protein ACMXYG_04395 [Candidatus Woesearchaeota archaeon]